MNKKVLIIILVVVLLVLAGLYFRHKQQEKKYYSVFIKKTEDATKLISVENEKNKKSDPSKYPISFTLNFWINIRSWEYNYGKRKSILEWSGFKLWLTKTQNHIMLRIPTYRGANYISVKDVPIKKWINISITLENRHADLWLNGKLHTSLHLSGLPKINFATNMLICNNGGFAGLISKFKYYAKPLKKKHLFNLTSIEKLFKSGPGSLKAEKSETDDDSN